MFHEGYFPPSVPAGVPVRLQVTVGDGEGVSKSSPSRLRCGSVSVHPQQSGLCCCTVLWDSWSEHTTHCRKYLSGVVEKQTIKCFCACFVGCGTLLVLDETETGICLVRRYIFLLSVFRLLIVFIKIFYSNLELMREEVKCTKENRMNI